MFFRKCINWKRHDRSTTYLLPRSIHPLLILLDLHWHRIYPSMGMVDHVLHYDFHIRPYHLVPLLYSLQYHYVHKLLKACDEDDDMTKKRQTKKGGFKIKNGENQNQKQNGNA